MKMIKQEDWWTFDQVEERLVEAMQLWHRSPGEGSWPFASDAPWHLLTRAVRMTAGDVRGMEVLRMLQADDEEETRHWQGRERSQPLTRDDVARRDEASEWLGFVADRDRQLLIVVLSAKACGSGRVSWEAIWKANGRGKPGPEGLQMRYRRSVSTICQQLNLAEKRERSVSSSVLQADRNKGC